MSVHICSNENKRTTLTHMHVNITIPSRRETHLNSSKKSNKDVSSNSKLNESQTWNHSDVI